MPDFWHFTDINFEVKPPLWDVIHKLTPIYVGQCKFAYDGVIMQYMLYVNNKTDNVEKAIKHI